MVLKLKFDKTNRIFKVYLLAMFALMLVRYLLKVDVPSIVFLLVAMLPIWFGSGSERLAFVASCIPLSIAFQYKYAFLILAIAILFKNRWRLKRSGVFLIVMFMMAWELWHAFYGQFSFVEYLRDFAELILLGIITSIDLKETDHKLIVRSLSVSVVGVCIIMLVMQLQQYGFDLTAVFSRSAHSFRFGQSNMASGDFALNFNANNLGFICNLSLCGSLLLVTRKEHRRSDVLLAMCSAVFALMTLSRSAVICMVMIFAAFLLLNNGNLVKKVLSGAGAVAVAIVAVVLIYIFVPSVFENILERFQRSDPWNNRGSLFFYYNQFLLSSPVYLLFGIGVQNIFEKVLPFYPVLGVPHMGLQEVCVAWGIVGVILMLVLLWQLVRGSKQYAGGNRQLYQFMPLALTLVFTMSGQLLTSSRALMALIFAYICMCAKRNTSEEEMV